jgi:ADP-heptose:LPS heptosyltransferase
MRTGDLLMHIKAIENLSTFANLNIYLLTHRQNRGLEFLFPFIKKIFYFDRELVQRSQKENYLPVDSGYLHTIKIINELNEIRFDTIYNFTNTKISALLISLINGKNKIGLICNNNLYNINDPNSWIKYLNHMSTSKIHIIDIFKKSILNINDMNKSKNLTYQYKPKQKKSKIICIQTLTSDPKKNWPFPNWNQLIRKIRIKFSDYKIYLLCAPSEKNQLCENFKENLNDIFVCNYQEAFDLISTSALVITGDTSIKHLASFSQTAILELALGSSNPIETGVYSEFGYLLYHPISCQPCAHSSCCNNSFACHSGITVQNTLESVTYILNKKNRVPNFLYKSSISSQTSLLSYLPVSSTKSGNNNQRIYYAE